MSVNISNCSYFIIQVTISLFNLVIMYYLKFCSIISLTVIAFGHLMFFLVFQVKKEELVFSFFLSV